MARTERMYEVVPDLVTDYGEEYFPAVGRASTLAAAQAMVRQAGFRLRLKGYRHWLRRDTPRGAPFWCIPVYCPAE